MESKREKGTWEVKVNSITILEFHVTIKGGHVGFTIYSDLSNEIKLVEIVLYDNK